MNNASHTEENVSEYEAQVLAMLGEEAPKQAPKAPESDHGMPWADPDGEAHYAAERAADEALAAPLPETRRGLRVEAPAPAPVENPRFSAPTPEARKYLDILERRIAEGTKRAARVIETIGTSVPTDQIAPLHAVTWEPTANSRGIAATVGGNVLTPSDYAVGQIAERAGVPAPYLRGLLAAGEPGDEVAPTWRRELAADILSRHYQHAPGRALVRSVGPSLRGWLSDRYRRLDSRPLVEALVSEAQRFGALAYDGHVTETRVAIKVVLPEVIEPIPGEYMILGAEWSNSDFGNGTHGLRVFAVRVVCLNGMTAENMLRQVHLGSRLAEQIELSDRTHRLDTAASASALRDIVKGAFGPARRETLSAQIREAAATRYSNGQLVRDLRAIPKATSKLVVDAYESGDVINLPPGENAWRASNAISWIAKQEEDAERRLDLERLAGSVLPDPRAEAATP